MSFWKTHPKRESEGTLHLKWFLSTSSPVRSSSSSLPHGLTHLKTERELEGKVKKTTQPSSVWSCRRFMPQPHRTIIVFAIDLHRRSRKLFLLSSSLFPFVQPKPRSYQTHPWSLIYNPISLSSPPSNPPTDLAAIIPTYRSRRETHLPILPYCWFGLYIQIFYYNICLETKKTCFLENFQIYNQTP